MSCEESPGFLLVWEAWRRITKRRHEILKQRVEPACTRAHTQKPKYCEIHHRTTYIKPDVNSNIFFISVCRTNCVTFCVCECRLRLQPIEFWVEDTILSLNRLEASNFQRHRQARPIQQSMGGSITVARQQITARKLYN